MNFPTEKIETQLEKLANYQQESLDKTLIKIKHLENQLSEQERVLTFLQKFPEKLEYDTLIPVADNGGSNVEFVTGGYVRNSAGSGRNHQPLAFMPAKLCRTNEVLVHLGGDWFVEDSAHNACLILERRNQKMDEIRQKMNEEATRIRNWLEKVNQVRKDKSEFVEIMEPYDEQKETEWRQKHRENVRKAKRQEAEKRKQVRFDIDQLSEEDELDDLLLNEEMNGMQLKEDRQTEVKESQSSHSTPADRDIDMQTDCTDGPVKPQVVEKYVQSSADARKQNEHNAGGTRPVSKFKAARMKSQ